MLQVNTIAFDQLSDKIKYDKQIMLKVCLRGVCRVNTLLCEFKIFCSLHINNESLFERST